MIIVTSLAHDNEHFYVIGQSEPVVPFFLYVYDERTHLVVFLFRVVIVVALLVRVAVFMIIFRERERVGDAISMDLREFVLLCHPQMTSGLAIFLIGVFFMSFMGFLVMTCLGSPVVTVVIVIVTMSIFVMVTVIVLLVRVVVVAIPVVTMITMAPATFFGNVFYIITSRVFEIMLSGLEFVRTVCCVGCQSTYPCCVDSECGDIS